MWAHILFAIIPTCWAFWGLETILELKRYNLQDKNQRPTQDLREHYYQSPYR